jgi:SAM-dependent methyltransferase
MSYTEYSQTHRHVLSGELPPLLERVAKPGVIADLGCGDGPNIWALRLAHKLGSTTYAVDLSPDRVRQAEKAAAGVQGIVADATATTLPDACVDEVIASQVIEHLLDDRLLAAEIARILKPGGWWYIGSVLRSPHAWWVYKGEDGQRLLDPTHLREYRARDDFAVAIAHPRLVVAEIGEMPLRFPVLDLAMRSLVMVGFLSPETISQLYVNHPRFIRARVLRVRAPGYTMIDAVGSRK